MEHEDHCWDSESEEMTSAVFGTFVRLQLSELEDKCGALIQELEILAGKKNKSMVQSHATFFFQQKVSGGMQQPKFSTHWLTEMLVCTSLAGHKFPNTVSVKITFQVKGN